MSSTPVAPDHLPPVERFNLSIQLPICSVHVFDEKEMVFGSGPGTHESLTWNLDIDMMNSDAYVCDDHFQMRVCVHTHTIAM